MEAMRSCPDCLGHGESPSRGVTCAGCKGEKTVPDLGECAAATFASEAHELAGRHCDRPADRVYDGSALCDSHALARACELGNGCPSCSGDISRGLHRGEMVGPGLVKTCSTTVAHEQLLAASERAAAALYSTGAVTDLEDYDEREEALTDSERNPGINE